MWQLYKSNNPDDVFFRDTLKLILNDLSMDEWYLVRNKWEEVSGILLFQLMTRQKKCIIPFINVLKYPNILLVIGHWTQSTSSRSVGTAYGNS